MVVFLLGWILFFLSSATLNAQNETLTSLLNSKASKEAIIANASSFLKTHKNEDSIRFWHRDFSYWLFDNGEIDLTIEQEQIALELAKNKKADSTFIQQSGINLGYYFERKEDLATAIEHYKIAINYNASLRKTITAYQKIGYCYLLLDDYYNSIAYYDLVIELILKHKGSTSKLRDVYLNAATAALRLSKKETILQAEYYALKADSLSAIARKRIVTEYRIKLCLAELNNRHENLHPEKAFLYYNQAIEIAKEINDSTLISTAYFGRGNVYSASNPEKAINYLEEALDITSKTDTINRYLIVIDMGTTYARMGQFKKSIALKHKALRYLFGSSIDNHKKLNASILQDSDYLKNQFTGITTLAESYLQDFETSGDTISLEKSLSYFKLADAATDYLKINSRDFRSRLFWRELSAGLYGKAIRASYLAKNIDLAYYYIEKNKALLLLEDTNNQQFKKSLQLKPHILKKEQLLKNKIYAIDLQLRELTNNASEKTLLKQQKLDAELSLTILQDSLKIKERSFNNLPTIETLSTIQKELRENEILLEYHIAIDDGFGIYSNNDKAYLLVASKNKAQLLEISDQQTLKEITLEVLKNIKKPFRTQEDVASYSQLTYKLYKLLIPEDQIEIPIKNKTLRIIPDNYLSLLPFEALSVNPDTLSYLLFQNNTNYQYSNSFLKSIQNKKEKDPSFLAITPITYPELKLPTLSYSTIEIENLEAAYKGIVLNKEDATKKRFIDTSSLPSIIHLATHANADELASPWVALYDAKLSLEELYLTNTNASLVFLSGCNTTLGKNETGEGIISLARGFFYGGAQSVISSLWSIDDRATSTLVNDFYGHLSDGKTKTEALREAKLAYVASHSLSEQSPYYWASFILIGKDNTIQPNDYFNTYVFFTLLLFIGLTIFLFYSKKNKKHR